MREDGKWSTCQKLTIVQLFPSRGIRRVSVPCGTGLTRPSGPALRDDRAAIIDLAPTGASVLSNAIPDEEWVAMVTAFVTVGSPSTATGRRVITVPNLKLH
jgi:hypothetical protein